MIDEGKKKSFSPLLLGVKASGMKIEKIGLIIRGLITESVHPY